MHLERLSAGDQRPLYRSLRKCGSEKFLRRTLIIADDWSYLRLMERRAVLRFMTEHPHGYNLSRGGEDTMHHTDATKAKASVALKRAWARTPERRNDLRGVTAMQQALLDPVKEMIRRANISATMKAKRLGVGCSNGAAKLSDLQVADIRVALLCGEHPVPIAARYNVSRRLIAMIRDGQRRAS